MQHSSTATASLYATFRINRSFEEIEPYVITALEKIESIENVSVSQSEKLDYSVFYPINISLTLNTEGLSGNQGIFINSLKHDISKIEISDVELYAESLECDI